MAEPGADVLDLTPTPPRLSEWAGSMWRHREVLTWLARSDFQVRYKRASFGLLWAVAVPLVQAVVLALVFSHIAKGAFAVPHYPVYVLVGVFAWSYFTAAVSTGATAIVDGTNLTDKVWFPRALLPIVPALSNLVGFAVSMALLLVCVPLFGVPVSARLLLLVPATALLFAFVWGLTLVLSALHVYFRDVRFLVQAALLVWFYLTPIAYPPTFLGGLKIVIELNPMTGIITLFHMATVGAYDWHLTVAVSVLTTLALVIAGVSFQRRRDRLFVDLL